MTAPRARKHAVRPALGRRTNRRLVAGVAGGLADWLDIDAATTRFAFILVMVGSNTAGMLAYGLAAAALPLTGQRLPGWDNLVGLTRLGLLLGGSTVLTGMNGISLLGPTSAWLPGAGVQLAGLAVLLAAGYRASAAADAPRTKVLAALPAATLGTVIALGVVFLPAFAWDRLVPLGSVLAVVALLLSVRSGSWRPFIAPAVVTTVLASMVVAADIRLRGGVGGLDVRPATASDVPARIERAVGDVEIDLTGVAVDAGPLSIDAIVGVGDLRLVIPERTQLNVEASVGRGEIYTAIPNINIEPEGSNFDVTLSERLPARHPHGDKRARPRVTVAVRARVGTGEFRITEVDTK